MFGKYLITASYVSDEMQSLAEEAKQRGLLFLNECGLDPGIDHMSAMEVLDRVRQRGGQLTSFESYTGGLIAPDTDPENPWRYKFTWNPRNVVMAGQSVAKYLEGGVNKFIPYQQLFSRVTPIEVPGHGRFEGYANRDSLKYQSAYGLQSVDTMIRGTLRFEGFCSAWNVLVQLGCCDDTYTLKELSGKTHRDFVDSFLPSGTASTPDRLARQLKLDPRGPELKRLAWSGFFAEEKIGMQEGTPAQVVERVLNKKWKLAEHDRDMIVMWHRFRYQFENQQREIQSSLVVLGDDADRTAMAKTVGWPLAIATKLLAEGTMGVRGVVVPTQAEVYLPILHELKKLGVVFDEREN
jgi:saccharopine dehydrogenase (NADP+, L-glutamate forming)